MATASVPFAAAAASCPVCLWLSGPAADAADDVDRKSRFLSEAIDSISSKMPGCFHVHFLQTLEAAPMA
jgi:hypothetical protein